MNFKANKQSTLKRTKNLIQSSLDDFGYEPGNLFQGGKMRLTQEINFLLQPRIYRFTFQSQNPKYALMHSS